MTKQVTIRGEVYSSQSEAAAALGVKPATIGAAAKAGTLEYVGLGPTRGERKASVSRRPVTIRGVAYASRADAAKALGVPVTAIGAVVRVLAPEPALQLGPHTFDTINAAALALNVSPSQIRAFLSVQAAISLLAKSP